MCVLSLQKPAVTSAPSSSEIDWEDIHLRVEQPVQLPAEEVAISSDGNKIAFTGVTVSSEGRENRDLWVASSDGSHLTRLTALDLLDQVALDVDADAVGPARAGLHEQWHFRQTVDHGLQWSRCIQHVGVDDHLVDGIIRVQDVP